MCIRDRKLSDVEYQGDGKKATFFYTAEERVDFRELIKRMACLLYTSDAADERSSVDLGGRRIIKKKKKHNMLAGHGTAQITRAYIHIE